MKVVEVNSYSISLYVGFKNMSDETQQDIKLAKHICQKYCDDMGLCVTVTPTEYIYTNGNENGCIVGFINYPRFPQTEYQLITHAKNIGYILKSKYNQSKISIVTPDKTLMISDDDI
jgi:hypothetical protein